jgi:hypothetical protein
VVAKTDFFERRGDVGDGLVVNVPRQEMEVREGDLRGIG